MAIKLIKACKELNIGMATLTAWCERNGYAVESDPNFRLDDDLYLRLAKEFNQDLAIKLEADREAEERAAANDPAYAEALQAKRAAERAARIAAAKAAADKAREDAQKQQTGSNLSLQNFDWDAYVVQQQGTKYKEEIQKYFQDLEFYDLEHYDRRHEQIQRVKNRTPEEKKARKERKEQHKKAVEMC